MIYEATPPGRGGGLGLFRTAMNLWEQFRDGGVRDQERARLASMQQQQQLGDQQMKVNDFNLQRLPIEAGQQDATHKSAQDAAAQQFAQADYENNRKKALQSIGKLPDMTPYELTPPAAEFGGWQGATGDELGSRLEQTPWADLNRAERGVVGKVPGNFSDLGPLDLSAAWDNVVGANTGGSRGNAPIQSSVTDGKATTTYEPRSILDAKRKSEYNQTFAKQVADHTARLQDAFRKDRPFMVWRTADNSFRALSSQLSKNDPNGASDLAAAIGFARMLDPDSVVREGERDIVVKRSGGFFDVLKAYANQFIGEGMVSATQRKNLIEAAATEMDAYTQAANNALRDLSHQGVSVGVDPQTIAAGPFVSPAEELRKSGVLPGKEAAGAGSGPRKFPTAAAAREAGLQPGEKVLIDSPSKGGWEEVTVGKDGSLPSVESAVAAPTSQPKGSAYDPADKKPLLRKLLTDESETPYSRMGVSEEDFKKIAAEDKAQGGGGLPNDSSGYGPGLNEFADVLKSYWLSPNELAAGKPGTIRHAPLPMPQKTSEPISNGPSQHVAAPVGVFPQVDFTDIDTLQPYVRQTTPVAPVRPPLPPLSNEDILRLMAQMNGQFLMGVPPEYRNGPSPLRRR